MRNCLFRNQPSFEEKTPSPRACYQQCRRSFLQLLGSLALCSVGFAKLTEHLLKPPTESRGGLIALIRSLQYVQDKKCNKHRTQCRASCLKFDQRLSCVE